MEKLVHQKHRNPPLLDQATTCKSNKNDGKSKIFVYKFSTITRHATYICCQRDVIIKNVMTIPVSGVSEIDSSKLQISRLRGDNEMIKRSL